MPDAPAPPFTIIVVDDDLSIRKLVRLLLRRSGFTVLEAASAEEARSELFNTNWDLAILDRRLPDIDGVVLAHQLKSNPEFRARYVIMLTGEDEQRDKIEGLELGADDYVTKPFQPAELLARVRAGKRIVDLQKELIASNKRLELLSVTDGLTNLYNHRYLQEQLSRAFEEARRYERPLSFVIIDLDFFKKINDTWGHAAGDNVLREMSKLFQGSIRVSDIAARYGGEEFAVMMPETSLEDAIQFAEKVRIAVQDAPVVLDDHEIPVTVSVGVASFPHTQVKTPRELIEAADRALYRAKRGGRNQVHAEKRKDLHRKTKRTA